jgi:site-specific recombinase XerD
MHVLRHTFLTAMVRQGSDLCRIAVAKQHFFDARASRPRML